MGAVLVLSLAVPRVFTLPSSRPINYGYGFPPAPVQYHPLPPARIYDTRNGTGGAPGKLGSATTADIQVTSAGGVPAAATAAVLNMTVANGTIASYLTVYPTGTTRPLASNLNWTPGQTTTNLVEVTLGTGGKVTVFNAGGAVDVIADVQGYVSVPIGTPGPDGLFNPLVPARVLDTRNGTGAPAKLGSGATVDVQIEGADGVPATGVEAIAINLTATNPTVASYVTAYPTGAIRPLASNLNFVPGQTVPNRAIVKLGTGGKITLFNAGGAVDLVGDVNGWFTDGTQATAFGAVFTGASPSRILDTRNGSGPLGGNSFITLQVSGNGGVPATGATAAVLNVTVTQPNQASYLTVWPDGTARPLASDLNWVNGLTIPNLVIVKLGANGKIDIYNAGGNVHVVVDVMGWYQGG